MGFHSPKALSAILTSIGELWIVKGKYLHGALMKLMAEDPYSNRELREMFEDITQRLTRIESQTTKTNGRVTDIEKRESGNSGASRVWGYIGATCITVFFAWASWVSLHLVKL